MCGHQRICGGNTRVRAFQTTGDPWAEDPACYLSDGELGIERFQYEHDGPVPMDIEKRRVRFAS